MARDFIPNTWAAFGEWMENFNTQFAVLAAKYGLAALAAEVEADNAWVQYWVQAKFGAKQQDKQLTDYIDGISGGDAGDASPSSPTWELPPLKPAEVAPGLKQRIRSTVRQVKANPVYSTADGELLGIIPPHEAGLSPENTAPELKLKSLPNFALEAEFRRFGLDALRVEFRHKGGNWQLAATFTSSPGVFNIIPNTPGEAEQIEIRAIFIEKNQPYGNYSPIYTTIIQP